jgi:predicted membrane protein
MSQPSPQIRISAQLITGVVLAALGVLFTLDNLHVVHAREILRYWPAALLIFGISQIMKARSMAAMIGASIWILFGGVLLGERLNVISSILGYWPLLLVGIGAYIVFQSFNRGEVERGDGTPRVSAVAVLGGVDRRVLSAKFPGADITAFMGGGKLDLREAVIAPSAEAVVDVTAIMGGYEITVPETWAVSVELVPFMGGYEDKTRHPADPTAPRLRIRGFVMMGGVEIRN